jgi:ubiquinone/menaquinone biosynthesis C-methylase UbiE
MPIPEWARDLHCADGVDLWCRTHDIRRPPDHSMTTSKDIAERFWNLPQKGDEEERRELLFMDDIIQKAHLDREIERCLEGVDTVLDAGAGTGRFSLPLAQRGLEVLHYDISQPMIARARGRAAAQGIGRNLRFEQGSLEALEKFADRSFDLVLSLDAPVSYTFPNQASVLAQLTRVASRALVVSVSSRLGYVPYAFNPASKNQYFVDQSTGDPLVGFYRSVAERGAQGFVPRLDAIEAMLETGLGEPLERVVAAYDRGQTPWPPNYLFLPEELEGVLHRAGLTQVRCSGPGALARSIPGPILRQLLFDPELRKRFLDFCYAFDSRRSVAGLGKDNLVASGRRELAAT